MDIKIIEALDSISKDLSEISLLYSLYYKEGKANGEDSVGYLHDAHSLAKNAKKKVSKLKEELFKNDN